jgi:lipoprotein NlpI
MRLIPAFLTLALVLAGCTGNGAETAEDLVRQAQQAAAAGKLDDAGKLLDQAIKLHPTNALPYYFKGALLDQRRQFEPALASLDQAIKWNANFGMAYQLRGAVNFKLARLNEALRDFDQFLVRNPGQIPHHWQRGIALYYLGKFPSGVLQFTEHQKVNPRDVENAVWHFLCNARVAGVAQARQELIPIEGDPRVPMNEIHDLYAGKGSEEKVLAAAEAAGKTDAERRNPRFFAHLYLGLYYEALGDAAKSRAHIEKAAKDYSMDHYMGDVARVHLKLRDEAAALKKKQG